jgi:hypothetical protein
MQINKSLIYTLIFSLSVVWFYSAIQRETIEPTKGAVDYYWAYQKIKGETPEKEVRWPYNKRTGMPFLASLLPLPATEAFRTVNIISGLICIFFAYKTLELMAITGIARFACLMPLLFFEWSPLRFPFMYPFEANPPAMMLYAMAAYYLVKKDYIYAVSALAISCSIRESGFFFALILATTLWMLKEVSGKKAFFVLAIAFGGLIINRLTSLPLWQPTNALDNGPTDYGTLAYSGTQAEVIKYFIKYRLTPPHWGIVSSLSAILMCLAPFLMNQSLKIKFRDYKNYTSLGVVSLCLILLSALMSTFGGKETPRIFFTGYPLYLIFLGYLIKNEPPLKILFLIFVGLITHSFTATITENAHWGWIPTLADQVTGRWIPLPVTYFVFWGISYIICQSVNWANLENKLKFILHTKK